MKTKLTFLLPIFALTLVPAGAAVRYVNLANSNPAPPYTNWASAATNIQDAIDVADAGDEIVVTNGVYATGGRAMVGAMTNRVEVTKPVMLRSVNGPEFTVIQGRQVPGSINGDGAIRCVSLLNGASLSGFTLTNGATRSSGDVLHDRSGGGVWCESATTVVSNCLVAGNSASYVGGGAYQGTLNNCTLTSNSAGDSGGGAHQSTLNTCILTGNSAAFVGGGASSGTLKSCTLAGNSAGVGGGAADGTLNNCTLTGNSARQGGGAFYGTLNNCIVYHNTATQSGANYLGGTFNYSCTTPLPPGAGNIADEPQLVDAFHLSATSPCRGRGHLAYATGEDIDGQPWALPPSIGCHEFRPFTGPITVEIHASCTVLQAGSAANFTPQIGGGANSIRWDFGDGTVVSNQFSVAHSWANSGEHTVVFTAFNEDHPEGVAASLTIVVITAPGPVLYVSRDSATPASPYTSWNTAAKTIQEAVDALCGSGTIIVSNGVYSPVSVSQPITIRSLNGPEVTTIDGGGSARCVYLGNDAARLSGFTLSNGAADFGAGVRCASSGVVVSNCVLINNSARNSGGGAFQGTLNNCTLTGNSANLGGGASGSTLNNCTLTGNSALNGGGAYSGRLDNCRLTGNSAVFGGGVLAGTLKNCALMGNSARDGGGVYLGALTNCTLTGNWADFRGGGAHSASLYNCIVYYNMALSGPNYFGGTLNYSCTTPLPPGIGNITEEPQFLAAPHISATSPCRWAGNAASAIGVDIDGEPWANPPAIGCDEYQPGILTGPLTVRIVASHAYVAAGVAVDFLARISGEVSAIRWEYEDGTVDSNRFHVVHAWPRPGAYDVTLRAFNETYPEGLGTTVTVHVLDLPVVSVREDAGSAVIVVARGDENTNTFTVDYATSNLTAKAGLDYLPRSGTLTFLGGEAEKSFTVPILNDGLVESVETVRLTLSYSIMDGVPDGGGISQVTFDLTILDNDNGMSLSAVDSVREDAGPVVFVISRGDDGTNTVTVDYATSDVTTTAGLDYGASSGTLTFLGGETEKSFTVPILNDGLIEGDESFRVTLGILSGGAIFAGGGSTELMAYLAILDDDTGIKFSGVDSAREDASSVLFAVTRGDNGTNTITVDYATSNLTATAGLDYLPRSGTLTFLGGETEKSFTVPILNDGLIEGDELLKVMLSNPGGGAVFANGSLTEFPIEVTILDNDSGVEFSRSRYTLLETSGVATITVRRGDDGPNAVTVDYATSDGTARAEVDYTARMGTLRFEAGETNQSFTIPLLDDPDSEGTETVFLTLANVTGGASLGANRRAMLSLLDNETPPLTNVITTAISAGETHTLVLHQDGSLWAWGENGNGQLGDGSSEYRPDPVPVGSDYDWCAVAAGQNYSIALKNDGSLWAWGANWNGQLGIGTTGDFINQPTRVDGCLTWSVIAADRQTLALRTDGSLWAWGRGVLVPTRLSGGNDWTAMATGPRYTLALKGDGSLWALESPPATSAFGADRDWVTITTGGYEGWGNYGHVVAFKLDGSLWAWGENGVGQLGDGTTEYRPDPVRIGVDDDWVGIAAGRQHTLALKRDGTMWGWGANNQRQLGDGTRLNRLEPTPIGFDNDWIAVDAGGDRAVALKSDGSLWRWGVESPTFSAEPLRITPENDWSVIAAGGNQSLAIQTNGSLWNWGNNQVIPGRLEGADNLQVVAAGYNHTLALTSDGSLWARGDNGSGQLGDGSYDYRTNLVRIGVDTDWRSVACGSAHSIGLKADGSLWAWGGNWVGQLGNGTTLLTNSPQRIGLASIWAAIAAGSDFSLGLKAEGSLWAWGYNGSGQLGLGILHGTETNPVRIGTSSDWRAMAAGNAHAIALKRDGSLWAWGQNWGGQLGDGTSEDRSSPTRIGTDNDWAMIAAGGAHTLALKSDGSLWAWGANGFGQLGLGSPSGGALSPFRVGTENDWLSVAAGEAHTLALKADGSLWAWGNNDSGQLGDPTGFVPARVGEDYDWGAPATGTGSGSVRFTGSILQPGGRLDLFFATTLRDFYYLLQRGDSPANIQQTVDATLGDCDPRVLADSTPVSSRDSAFYRIRAVPLAQPLDSDGDGIDDVYELHHRVALHPLNPSDAAQDFDDDGRSNLQEYIAGTDPAQARHIVAAGLNYTVLLKTDGSLWAWGENTAGQLGDGTTENRSAPVRTGTDTDWSSVSVGRANSPVGFAGHTLALKRDGSLWSWGANYNGQLGVDTPDGVTNRPVRVGIDNDWTQVAAGSTYTLARKRDGSLWGWGGNLWGVLGCCAGGYLPTRIGNSYDWQTVAAGGQHVLALKTDGSLWAWGNNESGQLGLDTGGGSLSEPTRVGSDNDWIAIAASGDDDIFNGGHSLAIKSDGSLWAWGQNQWGNLGFVSAGDPWRNFTPARVGTNTDWAAIAVSGGHSLARKRDGSLWLWGFAVADHPIRFGTNDDWMAFAVAGAPNGVLPIFAVSLKTGGSLWFSILGGARNIPTAIGTDSDWARVAAGSSHTLALKTNGTVWAWGNNCCGQLGDGMSGTNRFSRAIVGVATDWLSIAAGGAHTLGLRADGSLWAWGANYRGQLGDGTLMNRISPVRIGFATDLTVIAAGEAHTATLKIDGTIWAWGGNYYGQLGNGTTIDQSVPIRVGADNDWTVIATRGYHTVALKSGGSLWAWGANSAGQLGDGTTADRLGPVRIGLDNNCAAIAAGYGHTFALKGDGSLWAWGYNHDGQLGDGTTTDRSNPVRIGVENDWAAIAAGGSHSLGLKMNGSLWVWGANWNGQLGDGTLLPQTSPIRIGTDTDWESISAGYAHSLARKNDGTLWAWGLNDSGQLGIPADLTPHRVGTDTDWGSPP